MTVRERLERLTGERPTEGKQASRQKEIDELRRRIDRIMSRRPDGRRTSSPLYAGEPVELHEVVSGDISENEYGQFFLARSVTDGSTRHGDRCVREVISMDMRAAAFLAKDHTLAQCDCTDGLFLDTETTGLAGGSGTFAFLIGVGWFEGESFITAQIFARDFSEERACLAFLQEVARGKEFLVTFNGKAFDVNLLSARFIMNRFHNPLVELPHIDLIHPSRRLLGHRLDNSRLVTLEQQVLGLTRRGDVPGSEIPQRYFDWLRRHDGRLMKDVFTHNCLDVISMATLAYHLSELLKSVPDMENSDHRDLLAAARLFADRRHWQRAYGVLGSLRYSTDSAIAREAGKLLSLFYKRAGRWDEAVEIWEKIIEVEPLDIFAAEELAKWCEHRQRDFERALCIVSRVLECSRAATSAERAALVYRCTRLRRRLGMVP